MSTEKEAALQDEVIQLQKAEIARLRGVLEKIATTKRVYPTGDLEHMVVTYCTKVDYLIDLAKEALAGEHEAAKPCPTCSGTGRIYVDVESTDGQPRQRQQMCECGGTGIQPPEGTDEQHP